MLYWLSFVDATTRRHLGCSIVEIDIDPRPDVVIRATILARMLGINPGGEVACFPIPPEEDAAYRPYLNRLMTADELRAAGLTQ